MAGSSGTGERLISTPSLVPVQNQPSARDHMPSTNARACAAAFVQRRSPVTVRSMVKNATQSTLCSVEPFGTGSFAPLTPNEKPPNGFVDHVFVVIHSPMRTAASR